MQLVREYYFWGLLGMSGGLAFWLIWHFVAKRSHAGESRVSAKPVLVSASSPSVREPSFLRESTAVLAATAAIAIFNEILKAAVMPMPGATQFDLIVPLGISAAVDFGIYCLEVLFVVVPLQALGLPWRPRAFGLCACLGLVLSVAPTAFDYWSNFFMFGLHEAELAQSLLAAGAAGLVGGAAYWGIRYRLMAKP